MIFESNCHSVIEPYFDGEYSKIQDYDEFKMAAFGFSYVPDAFNQGMHKFMCSGLLDVTFVFASRIALDVENILGEHVASGETQLKTALQTAERRFDYEIVNGHARLRCPKTFLAGERKFVQGVLRFLKLARRGPWEISYRNDIAALKAGNDAAAKLPHSWDALGRQERGLAFVDAMVRIWGSQSHDFEAGKKFMEEYGSMPPDTPFFDTSIASYMPIGPSEVPFNKPHHPAFCGSGLLELHLKMERVQLAFANQHLSIFLMAHLYNAARQTGALGLNTCWPKMDEMINTHIHTIFSGELPKDEDRFIKLFFLKMGYSPKSWCKERAIRFPEKLSRGKKVEKPRPGFKDGPQLHCSKVSLILRQLYDKDQPISIERCLFLLNQQSYKKSESVSNVKTPLLSAVELLRRIRDWLEPEMQQMQIDYMQLNDVCSQLLKRIRLSCLVELNVKYRTIIQPGEEIAEPEYGYINMVMNIFSEITLAKTFAPGEKIRFMGRESGFTRRKAITEDSLGLMDDYGEEPIILPGKPQLKLVGKVLEKFLTELSQTGGDPAN